MPEQPGTLGTPARPTLLDTEGVGVGASTPLAEINQLLGLTFDVAATQDGVLVFDGSRGQFTGEVTIWVDGSQHPVTSAEYYDGAGIGRPVTEWHLGARGGFEVTITNIAFLDFDTTVDDFEDGDLSEWTNIGETGGGISADFTITSGSVFEGSFAAQSDPNQAATNHATVSQPGDGLDYYPQEGDLVEGYIYCDDSDAAANLQVMGVPADGSNELGWQTAYAVRYRPRSDDIALVERVNGSTQANDTVPLSPVPTDVWVRVAWTLGSSTISATVTRTDTAEQLADLSISAGTPDGRAVALVSNNGSKDPVNYFDELVADQGGAI